MSLTIEDFRSPRFDRQRPVYRNIHKELSGRVLGRKERAIEGVTVTNNFNEVGYTYFPSDGTLLVNYLDEKNRRNVRLLDTTIKTSSDFEKCLKRADKKIIKYLRKNR